jgi:transposase
MQRITTIGLDLAKTVFQVHAVSAGGSAVLKRKLRRSEVGPFFAYLGPGLVGVKACSSAHYWAREIRALGHDVRLMPPAYVKPFVQRGKTDAADAEAISDAVTRTGRSLSCAFKARLIDQPLVSPDAIETSGPCSTNRPDI